MQTDQDLTLVTVRSGVLRCSPADQESDEPSTTQGRWTARPPYSRTPGQTLGRLRLDPNVLPESPCRPAI